MTPMVQPLRLTDGPWGHASISPNIGEGAPEGAEDGDAGGLGLQLAGGWAHMFSQNFGMQFGLTIPTFEYQQSGQDGIDIVTVSALLGGQTEAFSVVAGGDFGAGGGALIVGGTVTVGEVWDKPALVGLYGRRFWNWQPEGRVINDDQTHAWEVGARVRIFVLTAQYSYYELDRGTIGYEGFPGRSPGMHIVTLGFQINADSFR